MAGVRRRGAAWSRSPSGAAHRAAGPRRCARTPGRLDAHGSYVGGRPRPERAPGALGGAGPDQRAAGGVAGPRGAARGLPARAGLVGLPRPAHAAGRDAGDDRGARGRHGRRTRRATTARSGPRSTGWCGWSTTSSSCPGSTPACSTMSPEPVALRDVVSEAIAGADPVARRPVGAARRPGRGRGRGRRRRGRAVPGDDQPGHERDPAHARRRRRSRSRRRAVPDGVELSVTDECGGISEDDMQRVFDVAWQGCAAPGPPTPAPRTAAPGSGWPSSRGSSRPTVATSRVENVPPRRRPGRPAAGSW